MDILANICVPNTFKSYYYNNNLYYKGLLDRSISYNIDDIMLYESNQVILLNDYFSCLEIKGDKTIFEDNLIFEFRSLSDFYKSTINISNYVEFIILPENFKDVKIYLKEICNIIYISISNNLNQLYDNIDITEYLGKLNNITDLNSFIIDPNIDFTKMIMFDMSNNTMVEYKEEEEETFTDLEVDEEIKIE